MPVKRITAFSILLLLVFAGQVPVALTLMGELDSSDLLVVGGMVLSIIAGVAAIGVFLSAAEQLNDKWMEKADLALKAAGALLAIVITFWFGLLQHQQEKKDKDTADKKAAQDQLFLAGKLAQEHHQAENAIRIRELIPHLASTDAYFRLQAVTNVGGLIFEQDSYDLTATQALFTASRHDSDEKVRKAALQFLPAGIEQVTENTSFVAAVIELAQKKASADWTKENNLYLALATIKDSAGSADTQKLAGDLIVKLSSIKIADASKLAAAINAAPPESKAGADNTAELDKLARSVVYSLASTTGSRDGNVPGLFSMGAGGDETESRQIRQAIQSTSPDAVASAIQNLPSDVARKLSARVYLQIAGEAQREQAKTVQSALWKAGYICPGIQNIKGHGYIPDTLEVRYFVLESKSEAEKILQLLKDNGAKDGRVSYVIPSANDLRISPDIKSHFEVWAGKSSF